MKNHRQFSLASLAIGTTGVGVAFAILPYPFGDGFHLVVGCMCS